MPSAIGDPSTLIHLGAIGRLGLLRDDFESVTVPPGVWQEVVEEGSERPGDFLYDNLLMGTLLMEHWSTPA